MEHREYKRIVPNAKEAIVFIHGIVGTPNHFQNFLPLVPPHISVHNLLLDGHGKGVVDFSGTSMKKWEAQVEQAVNDLAESHERVYLVAHSMGTLLALDQVAKNRNIAGLFLLAVPVKLFIKPKMVSNVCKVFFDRISPDDKDAIASRDAYGIGPDKNILHYIGWIPRYLELFAKIRKTRRILAAIDKPCRIFQSRWDEMVSIGSLKYLKQIPTASVSLLEGSGHYYYEEKDLQWLMEAFSDFLP